MIALVTCSELPELDPDDQPLLAAFRARGIEAVPAIWDDAAVDWRRFTAAIVRNPWDYVEKAEAFRAWLRRMPIPVWNPPAAMLANTDKTYLRAWEAQGVPIVPTEWFAPDDRTTLAARLDARGWNEAVLKPAVSAGSRRTHRFPRADAARFESALREIQSESTALLQPYLPEIASEGEWSFLFFGGTLSHVVLKRPAEGDFRAHRNFGGRYALQTAVPEPLVAQARRALEPVKAPLLYARVDMVRRGDALLLSELEITEPSLYLALDPQAPARFVAAYLALSKS